LQSAYDTDPTLPNAAKIAASLRDQYQSQVHDQIVLNRTTGLLLVGAAGAAAGLGSLGVAKNAVLGMTLGGAAAYTGTTYLSTSQLESVYAAGANALQCALDVMQPMQVAYGQRDNLVHSLQTIQPLITTMQTKLLGLPLSQAPDVMRARYDVEIAQRELAAGQRALTTLDSGGADLRDAVSRITGFVTSAIIEGSPSLANLEVNLAKSLPTVAQNIGGATTGAGPAPAKGQNEDNFSDTDFAGLESAVATLHQIDAMVFARPQGDRLRNCAAGLSTTGLTMSVFPDDATVKLADIQNSTTVTFHVVGGALPYQGANWIGAQPGDSVSQPAMADSGKGLFTVAVSKTAPLGDFDIVFFDNAGASQSATLHIAQGAPHAVTPQRPPPPPTLACTPDASWAAIQNRLVTDSIPPFAKTPKLVDGCFGATTATATTLWLATLGKMPLSTIPPNQAGLLATAKTVMQIK
jgi:hypothetical protein